MPRSQKIRLDLTGDARRGFDELARSIEGAQKKVSKFSQTTISGDQLKGLEREFNRQDQVFQRKQKQSYQQDVQRRREGAQIHSVVAGTGAAVGGGVGQVGVTGASGVGQILAGRGLGVAAGAVGGVALAAKAIGAAARSFTTTSEQLGQMAALGGRFDMSVAELQTPVIEAAKRAALPADQVRKIATTVSAQTGNMVPPEMLKELATMSRAFSMNAEAVAQFVAQQARFGTGVQLRKTLTEGIRSGMQVGQLPEYLQGIQAMQEQMIRAGITQQIDFHAVTRELGALGDAWKGKYGAARAMGVTAAFQGAARGEGGTGTNIMFAALSRQFKDMSYYQLVEQMEMGAADTDNLAAVRDYIQTLTTNQDAQARLLQGVFSDWTFTQAKDFMQGYQENRPAVKRQTAELTVEKQIEGYKHSSMRDRMAADIKLDQLGTDAKETAAGAADAALKAAGWLGDRFHEEMVVLMSGLNLFEREALVSLQASSARGHMMAATEAGIPIETSQQLLVAALREANEGAKFVTLGERTTAIRLFIERIDKMIVLMHKTGSVKLPRQ